MNVCGRGIVVEGGLYRIARLDGDKYKFLNDPAPIIEALKKSNTRVDLFTFMQKLPESSPKYDYPRETDNLAVLPVSTFDAWWTEKLGFKARNKAKQAQKKGVEIREVTFDDALAKGIWEIYNESPVRQGRRFPHYGKSVQEVTRMTSTFPESSVFIGAFLEEKLIGFIKLVTNETNSQAGMMHIVSMIQHRDKAPTNALVAQAVRSCAERQIRYLVYSNFSYGKKERSGLSDFKERNGFEKFELPRYYVPLTRLGAAVYRLGLHHKLVDHLPESLLAKVRDYRYAWYKYRFPASAQDS